MTETDIANKYTRVVQTRLGQWIQAMIVKGAHTDAPKVTWKGIGRMHPVRALPENIEVARLTALRDRRFFKTCARCDEYRPVSLLLAGGLCTDCTGINLLIPVEVEATNPLVSSP